MYVNVNVSVNVENIRVNVEDNWSYKDILVVSTKYISATNISCNSYAHFKICSKFTH